MTFPPPSLSVGTRPIPILLVDDDAEDRLLTCDAIAETLPTADVRACASGEEALEHLRHTGRHAGAPVTQPGLILLDINMPRMDGFEFLELLRADPALRRIPVVMLTTSRSEADIARGYELGVNSYIAKPVTYDRLVSIMRAFGHFWLDVVELPAEAAPGSPRQLRHG
jgi:two-component system response regulator